MGLSLPGLALAHQLYVAVKAQGHGRLGTHSLMLALETMNGAYAPSGNMHLCICVPRLHCLCSLHLLLTQASRTSRGSRIFPGVP